MQLNLCSVYYTYNNSLLSVFLTLFFMFYFTMCWFSSSAGLACFSIDVTSLSNESKQSNDISLRKSQHVCEPCSKTFVTRANLRQHLIHKHKEVDVKTVCPYIKPRKEERAKSFICSTCGLKFSFGYTLNRHVRSRHAGTETLSMMKRSDKQYICSRPSCCKAYITNELLRRHVRQEHKDIDVNIVCPSKRRRLQDSIDHHTCIDCSKSFLNVKSLRRHMRMKHQTASSLPSKCYVSTMKCPGLLFNVILLFFLFFIFLVCNFKHIYTMT